MLIIRQLLLLSIPLVLLQACGGNNTHSASSEHEHAGTHDDHESPKAHDDHEGHEGQTVSLTSSKLQKINVRWDSLQQRSFHHNVQANGRITIPPNQRAEITSVMGARVKRVNVIAGQRVKPNQPLIHLEHPDLIQLQEDLMHALEEQQFQEKKFNRLKLLYGDSIASAENYQQTLKAYNQAKQRVNSLKAKLRIIGLDPSSVAEGSIASELILRAPKEGLIQHINVSKGSFVPANQTLMSLYGNGHRHIHLKVFEKDLDLVRKGQPIRFHTMNNAAKMYEGHIYSVGAVFETEPRAVTIHAHIDEPNSKVKNLLPGVYIRSEIMTKQQQSFSVPENGLVRESDSSYVFVLKRPANKTEEAVFRRVAVEPGETQNGWIALKKYPPELPNEQVIQTGAYRLNAIMTNTGGGGHAH